MNMTIVLAWMISVGLCPCSQAAPVGPHPPGTAREEHGQLAAPVGPQPPGTHTVIQGDTLWDIAGRYYKDPFQWPRISEANPPPNVHDPHWIYPGQVLVIPGTTDVQPAPSAQPPVPEIAKNESQSEEDAQLDEPSQAPATATSEETDEEPAAPVIAKTAYKPDEAEGTAPLSESISTRFPEGMVGLPPSTYRFKVLPGWKEDGEVIELQGSDLIAAEGNSVMVRIETPGIARAGQRFWAFRKAAPSEEDEEKTARYLAKIGIVEIRRRVKDKIFSAAIIRSNETVQIGDVLKLENSK